MPENQPPDELWYRPKAPTKNQITDTWTELFHKTADRIMELLPPKSPTVKLLHMGGIEDLYVLMGTTEDLEARSQSAEQQNQMPSFDKQYGSTDEQEWQPDGEEENGGTALVDSDIEIQENSILTIIMEIRQIRSRCVTAGIDHYRFDSIRIPENIAIGIIRSLSDDHRKHLANILLYQLAQEISLFSIDENDRWMDFSTIIDLYLDMPNVRNFHKWIVEG